MTRHDIGQTWTRRFSGRRRHYRLFKPFGGRTRLPSGRDAVVQDSAESALVAGIDGTCRRVTWSTMNHVPSERFPFADPPSCGSS